MDKPKNVEQNDHFESKPECVAAEMWNRFCKVEQKIEAVKEENQLIEKKRELRAKRKRKFLEKSSSNQPCEEAKTKISKVWTDLKPYMNINSHLVKTTGTQRKKVTSGLKLKIEAALKTKDYDKAMDLNDQLASREFAKVITEACEAKSYDEERNADEAKRRKKKEGKVVWRFEQKKKWETKGNM